MPALQDVQPNLKDEFDKLSDFKPSRSANRVN